MIGGIGRSAYLPTQAQKRAAEIARVAIEDFIASIPAHEVGHVLAAALVEAHGPVLAEHVANVIGRQAHMAGRA